MSDTSVRTGHNYTITYDESTGFYTAVSDANPNLKILDPSPLYALNRLLQWLRGG